MFRLKRKTNVFCSAGSLSQCLLFQQSGGSLCLFASTEVLPCLSKFSLISSAGCSRWRWQGLWPGLRGTDGRTTWPKLPSLKSLIQYLHWCDPRQQQQNSSHVSVLKKHVICHLKAQPTHTYIYICAITNPIFSSICLLRNLLIPVLLAASGWHHRFGPC